MNEMAPLSPRLAAILEQARGHPPLPVSVVDAQEAHVLAGVVEASDHGLIERCWSGRGRRSRPYAGNWAAPATVSPSSYRTCRASSRGGRATGTGRQGGRAGQRLDTHR
ncbi:MAG: hypothetical protein WBQ69_11985 [Gallionella sp.]